MLSKDLAVRVFVGACLCVHACVCFLHVCVRERGTRAHTHIMFDAKCRCPYRTHVLILPLALFCLWWSH